MKVIITGATGFIGSAVVNGCIANQAISSIITLSRRDLKVSDTKVTNLVIQDFKNYSESEIEQMKGAEAAIWCQGVPKQDIAANFEYPLAGVKAFETNLITHLPHAVQKFRFVYLSGALVERDQNKSLWFAKDLRLQRGDLESRFVSFEEEHSQHWQTIIAKPAGVLSNDSIVSKFLLPSFSIWVQHLAEALIDAAINGSETQTLENAELKRRGQMLLS
ncbi:hypothetical protein K431DRAFT_286024 [Polychaeton citri CBS 116435]|uniref:NAD-dependent epimerase/dehydratase domain-containing protein n=1 Tax=Polychaeton citri CBS 116435 TaxID=1314669 RepID=A0A9P4ULI3_9PEZI|nr:hypothetical protein K431DRAFT_286024 [Polychaeton citri CBS 116435]